MDDVSSDEGTSDGSEEEEEGEGEEDEEDVPKRAGFDSDSESESVKGAVLPGVGSGGAAQHLLCGLPSSRFYLPPDPSRQPNMVLVSILEGEEFFPKGINLRVCPIKGAVQIHGGAVGQGTWATLWGAEGDHHTVSFSLSSAREGFSVAPASPLLQQAPALEEYRWAVRRADDIVATFTKEGRVGACLLVVAANRSALLEYIHSSHPLSRPQVLGPILSRLKHCDAEPLQPVHLPQLPDSITESQKADGIEENIRIAVVGAQHTGKSTLCKYISNVLTQETQVVYLDTDLGQPEFTTPGAVSLIVLSSAVLGPSYTHIGEARYRIAKSVFLGATSCQSVPFEYCRAVSQLLSYYSTHFKHLPLVVNTHGWVSGLGLRCLSEVLQRVAPNVVCNTGGVGRKIAADGGAADTQEARVHALLQTDAGVSNAFLSYYESCRDGGGADETQLCGAFCFNPPRCTVELFSKPPSTPTAKGWWARQASLTVAICGASFNTYCRALDTYGSEAGHAMIRSFFAASHPYLLPLNKICVYLRTVEWEGEGSRPGACPVSAVAIMLERSVVALYHDEAIVREGGEGGGICIDKEGPSEDAELLAYGLVPTVAGESIYLLTSADPVLLSRANLLVGALPAPQSWFSFKGADSTARGRVALTERQGAEEKRMRVI